MAEAEPLDSNWLRANPLPQPDEHTDKNGRGRVLAIGGCREVPGGIQLTAEAALRAGAGKVRAATVSSAALPLGMAMPEVAVLALPETEAGEISDCAAISETLSRCDAVIAGPAMSCKLAAGKMIDFVLGVKDCPAALILDAAALMALGERAETLRARRNPAILTPHTGEMAAMMGEDATAIERDRPGAVREAARRFGAVIVLKGSTSLVACPEGGLHAYAGGGVGLATGGSGDVLAGIAAGLAARGADPRAAALWAVWLHGEAGRRCAEEIGPLGFLARELLARVPPLMRAIG